MPPPRSTAKRSVWELNPSLGIAFAESIVAGARTVAGVDATFVVTGAGAFVAGEVAGLCCVTAFDVAGSVAGLCCVIAVEVAGLVAGLCCVIAVEVAGLVAGLEAAWVVVSGSFGNGARVSDGSALAADGISTLGEFVVTGPGVFSFFARGCVVVSGAFGNLFNASAGAGIGLGSIEGAAVSFFATSLAGVTGAAATFCAGWSQPTS